MFVTRFPEPHTIIVLKLQLFDAMSIVELFVFDLTFF